MPGDLVSARSVALCNMKSGNKLRNSFGPQLLVQLLMLTLSCRQHEKLQINLYLKCRRNLEYFNEVKAIH